MTNLLAVVVLVLCLAATPVYPQDSTPAGKESVDDTSPRIKYSNDWVTHVNVPANWSLFNNTHTISSTQNSRIFFEFNGESLRPFHLDIDQRSSGSEIEYWGNRARKSFESQIPGL
jgi:hypothetical protein